MLLFQFLLMKTNIFHFPLMRIIPFFITGILISYYFIPTACITFNTTKAALLIITLTCTALLFLFKKNKAVSTLLLCLTALFLGITNQLLHEPNSMPRHYINILPIDAQSLTLEIKERLKPSIKNLRYYALVKKVGENTCEGKIALTVARQGLQSTPATGDIMITVDAVHLYRKPLNPGQFDYGKYLADKHIPGSVYTRREHFILQKAACKDLGYYAEKLRNKIYAEFHKKGLQKDELAVVMALLLGQQQDISESTVHAYQYAGAVHILSVSGLHIGFLVLFVHFILSGLPNSRRWNILRFCITLSFLWSFAFLSGLSPSVIRSVTMFSFVAMGKLLNKDMNIYHTLLLSLFVILLAEPAFLFDAGFQLSYLSLFFIVWLQPLLSKGFAVKNKVGNYFVDMVSVSFAAQIGVLPLGIYYFHQFPGLFFVTNLIILPGIGVIMALGTFTTCLAAFGCAPVFVVRLLGCSISLLNFIIAKIAGLTAFVLHDIPLSKLMMLASYLVIFMALMMFRSRTFRYYIAFAASLLIWNMCLFFENNLRDKEEIFIVFQQPRQTVLGFKNGRHADFFCTNASTDRNIAPYILANGIQSANIYPPRNIYHFRDKHIKLIDGTGIFTEEEAEIVILSGAPKLNLDRYLSRHKPEIIIADGSDYKSYVKLWKASCRKRKIPFHATAEKGFYMME